MSNPEDAGKPLPQLPPIDIPPASEKDIADRAIRPPSHNVGVGGILVLLYRNLIANLTNGHWFSVLTINKLMNDYLANQAKDNPDFNRANARGNLMKVLVAKSISFKSMCQLLIFAKFSKVTISIKATRDDGVTAEASVDVVFFEGKGNGNDKVEEQ